MAPFWLALQFLTRLPVPVKLDYAAAQVGRSLAWYPLVGLLLGAILGGAALLLQGQEPLLAAALVLALWVGLSGALHLDGLADSADAWVGGLGERERTLAIMKDPTSGPIGVTVLVLLLLLKFAALVALLKTGELATLILLPALARSTTALLFITTPYVRAGGIGEALAQHAPRASVVLGLLLLLVLALFLLRGNGLIVLLALSVVWLLLRRAVMRRLGGFTGDVAGAQLELLECVGLLVIALLNPQL
ncbi:MAG: adenosylcobinamide-GDP ribazoletransferase [Gammaproteobacteria bacterium]|nr:adenosylcobinamide-GDP ribazoletransferase [Gammaproteobacteria bacterium]MCW8841464.1 adenosylcobinamide-GDP ribazoletransferase [Gammaproteobacteria bacterium]MCW8928183.1 adenosylcobinamide-GDP ribazoletransferase [Gammaproteobacteria bacterium]MCW8958324.1 adenosylcobinamide-GDP ribazoletransferase [Gammaproteobacteria bacterium]MCW8993967.1 adenosylcobinamide-GDP ribazoletransferase [Gammaproteobacteria bacterium]